MCLDCGAMPGPKDLTCEDIAAIIALFKAGKSCKNISASTAVLLRSVQRRTKKFVDGGGERFQTRK